MSAPETGDAGTDGNSMLFGGWATASVQSNLKDGLYPNGLLSALVRALVQVRRRAAPRCRIEGARLFHVEQFVKRECGNLGLLEALCIVEVTNALNYGVLCLVAANGDFALFLGVEEHTAFTHR